MFLILFEGQYFILYKCTQMIKLRTVSIDAVTCFNLGATDWILPIWEFPPCSGSGALSDGVILMSFCPEIFFMLSGVVDFVCLGCFCLFISETAFLCATLSVLELVL